jgi:hypothetical protein
MALGITDARKENLVSDGFWCTPDLTGPKKLGLGTVTLYYFGRLRFRIANLPGLGLISNCYRMDRQ